MSELTHMDFKRLSYKQQELDYRLCKLEEEVREFKSWHSYRFPKEPPVESNSTEFSTEFHESLTDKQDVEE